MTYDARCLYCAGKQLLVTDITLIRSIVDEQVKVYPKTVGVGGYRKLNSPDEKYPKYDSLHGVPLTPSGFEVPERSYMYAHDRELMLLPWPTSMEQIESAYVQCIDCQMRFGLEFLDPEHYPSFRPPEEISVLDRHGGFTGIELGGDNFGGTIWRPGRVLQGNTTGHLVSFWKSFYQNNENVVQAIYHVGRRRRLPITIWFDYTTGDRIA